MTDPTPDPGRGPRVSIVVEWENALLSDRERSAAMLRELRRQAGEVATDWAPGSGAGTGAPHFELLLVYDEAAFVAASLAAMLAGCVGDEDDLVFRWRLLPTRDSGYYLNKDLGARSAAAPVVVFLDSDVVPERGWLRQVVAALDDPAVDIVGGCSYIEPRGLVGKVFALTWFFPLRSEDGPLRRVGSFFANNLAVRRSFYLQHPFPHLPTTSRGSCLMLAAQLADANIPVYENPRARVAHPAPNGFAHLCRRALAQGRDRLYRERRFGDAWSASWPSSCVRLLRHLAGSAARICAGFTRVGLNPLLIPAAVTVAWYYYSLYWVGETMSHLRIPVIERVRV